MKKFAIYFLAPLGLLYAASKISKSNEAYVQVERFTDDGVSTIKKLNELVEGNFLDREYYEVFARSDFSLEWIANYNQEHQALMISFDPMSGWSAVLSATPQELKTMAEQEIPITELHKFLKRAKKFNEDATRSRELISLF